MPERPERAFKSAIQIPISDFRVRLLGCCACLRPSPKSINILPARSDATKHGFVQRPSQAFAFLWSGGSRRTVRWHIRVRGGSCKSQIQDPRSSWWHTRVSTRASSSNACAPVRRAGRPSQRNVGVQNSRCSHGVAFSHQGHLPKFPKSNWPAIRKACEHSTPSRFPQMQRSRPYAPESYAVSGVVMRTVQVPLWAGQHSDNPSGLFTRIQVATRYLDILSTDPQIQLQKSAAMKPLDSLIIYTGQSDRKARSSMNGSCAVRTPPESLFLRMAKAKARRARPRGHLFL